VRLLGESVRHPETRENGIVESVNKQNYTFDIVDTCDNDLGE
jgi:hypothetical protein